MLIVCLLLAFFASFAKTSKQSSDNEPLHYIDLSISLSSSHQQPIDTPTFERSQELQQYYSAPIELSPCNTSAIYEPALSTPTVEYFESGDHQQAMIWLLTQYYKLYADHQLMKTVINALVLVKRYMLLSILLCERENLYQENGRYIHESQALAKIIARSIRYWQNRIRKYGTQKQIKKANLKPKPLPKSRTRICRVVDWFCRSKRSRIYVS